MDTGFVPHLGRLDRHVRRSYVRMNAGVSQHRVAWSLEEALRLANLPGEEEGRVYCFRRVSLTGIPAEAMRSLWMETVQNSLAMLARRSTHGADPRANSADAIYFNNLEEALVVLLRKSLRDASGESASPQWFATSLLGVEPQTTCASLIPVILDRLHSSFAPGAAAAILFSALGDSDPGALLSSVPDETFRTWLRAFDEGGSTAEAAPMELPQSIASSLQRAAAQCGWRSPALLWFAAQAILFVSPGSLAQSFAMKRARATIRFLESAHSEGTHSREQLPTRFGRTRIRYCEDENHDLAASPEHIPLSAPVDNENPDVTLLTVQTSVELNPPLPIDAQPSGPAIESSESNAFCNALHAQSTHSAGLFFLLNALLRTGIAASSARLDLADASLAAHILKRLAIEARVPEDDPVLLGISGTDAFTLPPGNFARLLSLRAVWPIGFEPLSSTQRTSGHLLRAWTLAVKLWCWRNTRLTIGEIIHRRGRVSVTRTDLDVVLPLDQADVRIRRAGLDIDPGWLPWFGLYGKVVRFHYRDREPENLA